MIGRILLLLLVLVSYICYSQDYKYYHVKEFVGADSTDTFRDEIGVIRISNNLLEIFGEDNNVFERMIFEIDTLEVSSYEFTAWKVNFVGDKSDYYVQIDFNKKYNMIYLSYLNPENFVLERHITYFLTNLNR